MSKLAFIGLGNMGLPMALNLKNSGFDIKGYDLSQTARTNGISLGLNCVDQLDEALDDASAIITMLPKGEHVINVWKQALSTVKPSIVLIDCSTIDINSCKELHQIAQNHGCKSLDAPVSGGIIGASNGTLTFMVGGDKDVFQDNQILLQAMGKNIIYCGAEASGQAAKICNNMILGISMIAVSEAFILAEKLGLSHQALYDVASTSSGQCWSLTSYCPVPGPNLSSPANNGYKPGFASELMLKDLLLAQQASQQFAAATPLGNKATLLYESYLQQSGMGKDFSGIIEWLRTKTGT